MVTVPAAPVETVEKSTRSALLADLRASCSRHGITQQAIADRCKVTRPFVVNLFAGRSWSGEVVARARAMVVDAERKLARARARKRNGDEA